MTDDKSEKFQDYDPGFINDYGGGDVSWWQDYLRAEIGRCNYHWREKTDQLLSNLEHMAFVLSERDRLKAENSAIREAVRRKDEALE